MRIADSAAAKRDIWLSICLILIGAVLYLGALDIPPPRFDPLGSAAVPKSIAICLIILAILVVLQNATGIRGNLIDAPQSMEGTDEVADNVNESRSDPAAAVAAFILPVAYVLLVQYRVFDFAIGSTLFVFAYGFVFMPVVRRKLIIWLIPVSVVIGVGLTLIYTQLFTIDLPLDAFISLGLSL